MKISVAGTGYVGLVTAVCLAKIGHNVTCVDVDEQKILLLQNGKLPIYEPGLEELLNGNQHRIVFITDYRLGYKEADVIIIGVGTPDKQDGSANLSFVFTAARQIAETIEKDCIVAVKSTVPVGTNERVEKIIKDNLKKNVRVEVVSNPEFLSQGSAVDDTLHAARIVLGVESEKAKKTMENVYEGFGIPYVFTDRRSAEMIKYASNNFLALKVSYINEIANICELVGANVEEVAQGMGMDLRIGSHFLKAGIGYGGSCFPKDTKAMHWLGNFNDCELKTVKATIEVNERQKLRLLRKAKKYFESLNNQEIAVLGLTFKPGTDDLREAPSLANIAIMLDEGARIKVWDPVGSENFKKKFPDQVTYCETIEETITDTSACFIFTEWSQIRKLDLTTYVKLMKRPLVIDGRNCYGLLEAQSAGIVYESIGRRTVGGC